MITPTKEDFIKCHERVAEPVTIVDFAARDALGPIVEKLGTRLWRTVKTCASYSRISVASKNYWPIFGWP